MAIDVQVPQIGESVTTVFISTWFKKPGDFVTEGESVVEVDSDKASMEVPAPSSGVLQEHLVAEGDEVDVGAVIARIDENAQAPAAAAPDAEAALEPEAAPQGAAPPKAKAPTKAKAPAPEAVPRKDGDVRAGPAARKKAHEEGITLAKVEGTGKHGRVTSDDVQRAATQRTRGDLPPPGPVGPSDRVERVPMTPLRRTIARRLVEAQQNAAILTTFNEVDMSAVMEVRKRFQDRFVARHGIKLGFMSFFVKAAIEALKEFPAVNAEIDGNEIIYKGYYNIGVAVSGPKGLVVPVVRNVDRLSFAEVEAAIGQLAVKARDNKLTLADFQDGTFTISNGGIFGSMLSTPILNPPQVGILGMHNIVERPVAIDGRVEIRPVMYLALSYDHRIIDGREAVSFLVRVKECIEDPERILLEV